MESKQAPLMRISISLVQCNFVIIECIDRAPGVALWVPFPPIS